MSYIIQLSSKAVKNLFVLTHLWKIRFIFKYSQNSDFEI